MNEWINVKDRLPQDGQKVLGIDDLQDQWVVSFNFSKKTYRMGDKVIYHVIPGCYEWDFETDNSLCCFCVCPKFNTIPIDRHPEKRTITHWMPLPEPPKSEDQ